MQMEMDRQYGVFYPEPIQGDATMVVTRQAGLPSWQQAVADPVTLPPVVQGSAEMVVTRQRGSGAQHFAPDGTLVADARADDRSVLYVDVHTSPVGDANPPSAHAPLTPTDVPTPPRPAFASDDGGHDPRDPGGAPAQVFTADTLPVIKKREIVPVVASVRRRPAPVGRKAGR